MIFRRRRPSIPKVLVLGCGPSGLFAAHAAYEAGARVRILSKNRKSHLFGAQYLQREIPGLLLGPSHPDPVLVDFQLNGSFDAYKRKVYADVPDEDAVPEEGFFVPKQAWDIRSAYESAWLVYGGLIEDTTLDGVAVMGAVLGWEPDLVVSTIPLNAICLNPGAHSFASQDMWALGDAPERDQFVGDTGIYLPENTVVYDGTPGIGWHRAANIFGYATVEWPEANKPPLRDVALVRKPVSTNCNCWNGKHFLLAGRYGAWHWSGQAHDAYEKTKEALG